MKQLNIKGEKQSHEYDWVHIYIQITTKQRNK